MKKISLLIGLLFTFSNVVMPTIQVKATTNSNVSIQEIVEDEVDLHQEELNSLKENDETTQNDEPQESNAANEDNSKEDNDYSSKYEKVIKHQVKGFAANITDFHYEKEEYANNMAALQNIEYLVPKTNSNYEVAWAYSDGSYSFVQAVNTIEEAIEVSESLISKRTSNSNDLPAVIDSNGVVTYSTNSMGRVKKYIGGQAYTGSDKITNLYQNENKSGESNYINQGYVSDVPVIEDKGKMAKIQVAGYTGWINKDTSAAEYDLVIIPMNQVHNPSYYEVSNGELYHWISYDITDSTKSKGYRRVIGVAPKYLKSGVKYYSYDLNYFYTDLNTLISDLKAGHNSNAVNGGDSYYSYYAYLPFRTKTNFTADEINSFIVKNTSSNSKLRGTGSAFLSAQDKYGVNAIMMLGVAINESGWGTSSLAVNKNNLFGLKAYDSNPNDASAYNSVQHCIDEFANYWISKGYADPQDSRFNGGFLGDKKLGANVKYASDPFWGEKAATYSYQIDREISGGVSKLRDYNFYQIGIFNTATEVKAEDKSNLYSVKNSKTSNASFVGTTVALNSNTKYVGSGSEWYAINPDRTTYLSQSSGKEFEGIYNWNKKGYIKTSAVKIVNPSPITGIMYQSHIQDIGWQGWMNNGQLSGTTGKALKIEGVNIKLSNMPAGATIKYRSHVQDIGWQAWKTEGQLSGTTGQNKKIEAIEIVQQGLPSNKEILYRAHVEDIGWQEWKRSGELAGTTGKNKRVEAIEIKIVDKVSFDSTKVTYNSHLSDIGWQGVKSNGVMSGTTGQVRSMEAIQVSLKDAPVGSGIRYKAHVQDIGWQGWVSNGAIAGTVGKVKHLEALQIELVGAPAGYHIEYRAHVQDEGWQLWRRDGVVAGSTGKNRPIEAIEIRIVKS